MQLRSLVLGFVVVVLGMPGVASAVSDDFNDGTIDAGLWIHGGIKRGWFGDLSGGGWTSSQVESGGSLELNVQGPGSANTYGAESWLRTTYDYNDGQNHVIDFQWEIAIVDDHYNAYQIQLTDGYLPADGAADIHWSTDAPVAGTSNLLQVAGEPAWFFNESESGPPGTGVMDWSVIIDPVGTAYLYDGAGGSGTLLHTESLDLGSEWYLRFMITDATSAGFSAGDASLILHSFSSTVPEPAAGLLLLSGLVGTARLRSGPKPRVRGGV